jgi:hypothetical protein
MLDFNNRLEFLRLIILWLGIFLNFCGPCIACSPTSQGLILVFKVSGPVTALAGIEKSDDWRLGEKGFLH